MTGSTPIQRVRDQELTEPENIVEFQTYTQCVDQLLDQPGRRGHHRRRDPRRLRLAAARRAEAGRRAVLRGALRHRPQQGRRRAPRQDQRPAAGRGRRRHVAEDLRRDARHCPGPRPARPSSSGTDPRPGGPVDLSGPPDPSCLRSEHPGRPAGQPRPLRVGVPRDHPAVPGRRDRLARPRHAAGRDAGQPCARVRAGSAPATSTSSATPAHAGAVLLRLRLPATGDPRPLASSRGRPPR